MLIALATFNRNGNEIDKGQTEAMISLKTDTKYIREQVNDIKQSVSKIDEAYSVMSTRVTRNEEHIKTLFNKYDELKNKMDQIK